MNMQRIVGTLALCCFGANASELPNAWFCVDSKTGGFQHEESTTPPLTYAQSSKYTLRKQGDNYDLIMMGIPADAPDSIRKSPCQLWTQAGVKDTAMICGGNALAGSSVFVMNTSTGVYERAQLGMTTQTSIDYRSASELAYGTCTPIDG